MFYDYSVIKTLANILNWNINNVSDISYLFIWMLISNIFTD